jgi:hypothetical protein
LPLLISSALAQTTAPTAPAASTTVESAHLHIYRPSRVWGRALSPLLYCDDDEIAAVPNDKYLEVDLPPGKHRFHTEGGFPTGSINMSIPTSTYKTMTLEPGKDYYVRLSMVGGLKDLHLAFDVVGEDEGAVEIKSLKPLDPSKIK